VAGAREAKIIGDQKILARLKGLPGNALQVVAGDFNAEPDSAQMKTFRTMGRFRDVLTWNEDTRDAQDQIFTWDVDMNRNTDFSARPTDARGRIRKGFDLLAARAGHRNRRLDHIFLGQDFAEDTQVRSWIVLKEHAEDVQPSDHFGVLAEVTIH